MCYVVNTPTRRTAQKYNVLKRYRRRRKKEKRSSLEVYQSRRIRDLDSKVGFFQALGSGAQLSIHYIHHSFSGLELYTVGTHRILQTDFAHRLHPFSQWKFWYGYGAYKQTNRPKITQHIDINRRRQCDENFASTCINESNVWLIDRDHIFIWLVSESCDRVHRRDKRECIFVSIGTRDKVWKPRRWSVTFACHHWLYLRYWCSTMQYKY